MKKEISPKLKGDDRKSKHDYPTKCLLCGNQLQTGKYMIFLIDSGTFDGAVCNSCEEEHKDKHGIVRIPYVYEADTEYYYDHRNRKCNFCKKWCGVC